MLVLAYDTETTGLMRGNDYTNPGAPFLAAIAMILYDSDTRKIVASFHAAVKPDDWSMPDEAMEVNGLTNEYLNAFGMPSDVVSAAIIALSKKADLLVAHNAEFDGKIVATALWRTIMSELDSDTLAQAVVKKWLDIPTYCTMLSSKELVKSLDKRGRIKYPKLTETYKFFFDRDLDRAHSANADAVAVLEIYLAIPDK